MQVQSIQTLVGRTEGWDPVSHLSLSHDVLMSKLPYSTLFLDCWSWATLNRSKGPWDSETLRIVHAAVLEALEMQYVV